MHTACILVQVQALIQMGRWGSDPPGKFKVFKFTIFVIFQKISLGHSPHPFKLNCVLIYDPLKGHGRDIGKILFFCFIFCNALGMHF